MQRADYHLVGIGGAGMSALAEILLDDGLVISGCDISPSDRLEVLQARGAEIVIGHDASHPAGADALITTPAVSENHPELLAARTLAVPVYSRARMLSELMREYRVLAVAGSHGKTTTSALLAHILEAGDSSPSVALGGVLAGRNRAGWRGDGSLAVCEADEYHRSFLELRPFAAILTNLEAEHLDYYGSEAALREAFETFLDGVDAEGFILSCGEDPGIRSLGSSFKAEMLSYGFGKDSDFQAADLRIEAGMQHFTVLRQGVELGGVRLPLGGRHNVLNALGALGAALRVGMDFEQAAAALGCFPGVGRRFESIGEEKGVLYIDDYAHHPTEIRAVIAAARQLHPERRVVVLFQPHLPSRTEQLAAEFAAALSEADEVMVLPVFIGREQAGGGISHGLILREMQELGRSAGEADGFEKLPELLERTCREGDLVLALNAGDLSAWLRRRLEGGRP